MTNRQPNSAQQARNRIKWLASQGFENRWTGWVDSLPMFSISRLTTAKGFENAYMLESKVGPEVKRVEYDDLKDIATKQLQSFVINAGLQFAPGYSTAHHTAQAESKTDTPKVGGAA